YSMAWRMAAGSTDGASVAWTCSISGLHAEDSNDRGQQGPCAGLDLRFVQTGQRVRHRRELVSRKTVDVGHCPCRDNESVRADAHGGHACALNKYPIGQTGRAARASITHAS